MRLDLATLVTPPHPSSLSQDDLMKRVEFTRSRSAGPGGQHRNKVATRVELLDLPTGIAAAAGERRSVRENRPVAIRRLRLSLAVGVRTPVPLGEIGSAVWRARIQKRRIAINDQHWDYPALLAEALDAVVAMSLDVRGAAIRLDVSTSQLTKLIGRHTPAIVSLNEARDARGMPPVHAR